ncbi:O-methyltransferase [Xanthomonas euvesicatoria]|uniref:O-methyltransferase n=1 Tax=Xanthomonas euvesicatoria TaxID=456327 RepID=UPI001C43C2C4|nr:class I SAM-dependent methyltransferase [Xanthomonas euvesicatoria]MBV6850516.1 class I SAM-dependent methyltransferase [Xanthomonas campestris pv. heliotropii]
MSTLQDLKEELSRFGANNDAVETALGKRMLNITPETGELLALLVHATRARQVLEVGTSNGYSTLWLAEAVIAVGGHVITLEHAEDKAALAAANFVRAGLQAHITQVLGDAGAWLETADDGSVDLLFLDSDRSAYARWWPQLRRVLKRGTGLMVVDNATSHATEMADFMQAVRADMSFRCSEVSVGNGQFMAVRVAD